MWEFRKSRLDPLSSPSARPDGDRDTDGIEWKLDDDERFLMGGNKLFLEKKKFFGLTNLEEDLKNG